MRAIAWIIRNRFTKKRWGDSYRQVVLKPRQFSCWNKNDSNYNRMKQPGKDGSATDKHAWQRCKLIFDEINHAPEETNPLPATQIKAWKQTALQAISDVFSKARDKDKKIQTELVDALYEEIGRLQAQLSWLKKKFPPEPR